MNAEILTVEGVIKYLNRMRKSGSWEITMQKGQIILRRFELPKEVFCPLTAVYYQLNWKIIHRCFLLPEFTATHGLDQYSVTQFALAADRCDCGCRYDRLLREALLAALGLPSEKK